jgi:hypothetical protein
MVTRTKRAQVKSNAPARVQLTDYESDQVKQIAVWKSRPPNAFAEMFRRVTLAGSRLVERVISDALIRVAIEQSFEIAERIAGKEDVKRRAGVRDLRDLRRKRLEECDHLAAQAGVFSQVFATAQGALTGAGGVLTTLVDIPLLFILSLRTILKIGHCYGYPLDQRRDRHFIIGTLIAAISGTPEARTKRLNQLHELEDLLITETQEEIVSEELLSLVFQLEIFEGIPGVGAVSGGVLNLAFMRRVDMTARRVFQERWLRDNGKVRSIVAAPVHSRNLIIGWTGAAHRAAYSVCYTASFAAALPVRLLASLFERADNSLTQGVRGGAKEAGKRVERFLGAAESAAAPRIRSTRGRRAVALA